MKLSISNIAWTLVDDLYMYEKLNSLNFKGLEIAPTRLFSEDPYSFIDLAVEFKDKLFKKYNLNISSMQSIWFGRSEGMFDSEDSRKALVDYTKKAILFASALSCHNLVFGCPRNRNIKSPDQLPIAIDFFKELGDFAHKHDTVLSIEPNPVIYNTNFINYTEEAFDFNYVNHVHISEPNMIKIKKRELHEHLFKKLKESGYKKYVSIEMKTQENIKDVEETLQYIKGLANDY